MRDLTTEMAAQVAAKTMKPVLFLEATFVSGVVRLFSGWGSIVWNSQTWVGAIGPNGELIGSITGMAEAVGIQAVGATIAFTTDNPSAALEALNDARQNLPVTVYLGAYDPATGLLLNTPYAAFSGTMDTTNLKESAAGSTVEFAVENDLIILKRTNERRLTHADQQIESPGDLGLIFQAGMANLNLTVGAGGPAAPVATPLPTR